jgi:hypothetical protein
MSVETQFPTLLKFGLIKAPSPTSPERTFDPTEKPMPVGRPRLTPEEQAAAKERKREVRRKHYEEKTKSRRAMAKADLISLVEQNNKHWGVLFATRTPDDLAGMYAKLDLSRKGILTEFCRFHGVTKIAVIRAYERLKQKERGAA